MGYGSDSGRSGERRLRTDRVAVNRHDTVVATDPVAIIVYIISFMERTNIGYAFARLVMASMRKVPLPAASLSATCCCRFQRMTAEHWSTAKFIAIIVVFWSATTILCSVVNDYTPLQIAQFFLGSPWRCRRMLPGPPCWN
jgi:hypothetical protein